MAVDDLTTADIIRAGSVSQKTAVRKAFDKLKFAILMAHTENEIEDLCDHAIYHLRISQKRDDGSTYDSLLIRWADDQFALYSPSEDLPVAGTANTLDKDPAIVYLNKPAVEENIILKRITGTMDRRIDKTKAKRK